MPYLYVTSGTSYITAPTLGNMVSPQKKFRAVGYVNVATTGVGYIHGQATSTAGLREVGLYITDASGPRNIDMVWGGTQKSFGTVLSIFGTSTPKGIFDFEADATTGIVTLKVDGVTVINTTFTPGTGRYDLTLFRIGARSNAVGASTTGFYMPPAGWQFGDLKVYVNDALVRDYVMPSSGTSIVENVSAANGTLQSPSGSDFIEYVADADTTPDAGSFGDSFNAALSTLSECANPVTITGVDAATNILAAPVAGTEICVSTNGGSSYGSWGAASVNVQLGHMVKVRKISSAYNSATVKAGVTIGGVLMEGRITTLATGSFAVKNIVVIGASIEFRPYGQSLTVPHTAGTAALAAAGLPGVNLYGWGHDGFTASQLVPKIAEAVAAFPYGDTIFLFHPFGNDVSNTRPYSSMTAGEITSFQNNVTNCMAAFGTARSRAYCMGISFRSYANPRTSKAIFNDQSLGSLPYYTNFVQSFLLSHELNTDGFPVYDYYNLFRNENETILDDDGIHELNPAGYTRVRQFVAQVSKSLFADGVKPAPIVPAPNYVAPSMPSTATRNINSGSLAFGRHSAISGTSPTYTLSGANASLFNINSSTGDVTFKALPSIGSAGTIIVTATNALGSSAQTINYTVVEYVAPTVIRTMTAKSLTTKTLTTASISVKGL